MFHVQVPTAFSRPSTTSAFLTSCSYCFDPRNSTIPHLQVH